MKKECAPEKKSENHGISDFACFLMGMLSALFKLVYWDSGFKKR
jgi:hypothetical protein